MVRKPMAMDIIDHKPHRNLVFELPEKADQYLVTEVVKKEGGRHHIKFATFKYVGKKYPSTQTGFDTMPAYVRGHIG